MPKKPKPAGSEPDSVYFLKILLYFFLGLMWIKWDGRVVFPAGLAIGLLFASHDHFRIDRKVEYAVLLVACMLALTGYGFFIVLG